MVDPLFFLRYDFKWVPRSHMYIMILKLKKLRKVVLQMMIVMQRMVKEGQKRDSSNHSQWKAFSINKKKSWGNWGYKV